MSEVLSETIEIKEQQRFYTDRLGFLTILLLVILIQCVLLIGVILYLRSTASPPPIFFPATDQGQLLVEPPLDKPSLPDNEVLNWVAEAMMVANTFNFANYTSVMEKAKKYFTLEGYDFYKKELTDTKVIERVTGQKLVLSAVPTDAPQITKEGELGGRYLWKVKVPMQFRFVNVTQSTVNSVDVTVLVMRVPTIESPNGLAILKIDVEMRAT